ncbi:hypothetical protein ACFQ0M_02370 [Kitasatospora aburaviensis]
MADLTRIAQIMAEAVNGPGQGLSPNGSVPPASRPWQSRRPRSR